MPLDKNHLYSKEDFLFDLKNRSKVKTQQQFSRFSQAGATALNFDGQTQVPTPIQPDTRPVWCRIYNDTIGSVGAQTVDVFFGTDSNGNRNYVTYNIFEVTDDITFAFSGTPWGKMIPFTLDFTINKISNPPEPVITWPSSLINPPTLTGLLTNGSRHILHFETVRDDAGERQVYIGGSVSTGTISDPIILGSHDDGNIAGPAKNIDWSIANHHYGVLTGNTTISMINLPALTKYEPLVLQLTQDGTGGRTVTFLDSFFNGTQLFVDTQPNAVNEWVFHTDGDGNILAFNTTSPDIIAVPMSDETTVLAVASSVTPFYTFFMDVAFYVTEVIISVNTPGAGAQGIEVDVKQNGTTIFSTRPTIDNGDNTSLDGAPLSVISTPQLLKNDKIECFLTRRDTNNVATGLKCKFVGVQG